MTTRRGHCYKAGVGYLFGAAVLTVIAALMTYDTLLDGLPRDGSPQSTTSPTDSTSHSRNRSRSHYTGTNEAVAERRSLADSSRSRQPLDPDNMAEIEDKQADAEAPTWIYRDLEPGLDGYANTIEVETAYGQQKKVLLIHLPRDEVFQPGVVRGQESNIEQYPTYGGTYRISDVIPDLK